MTSMFLLENTISFLCMMLKITSMFFVRKYYYLILYDVENTKILSFVGSGQDSTSSFMWRKVEHDDSFVRIRKLLVVLNVRQSKISIFSSVQVNTDSYDMFLRLATGKIVPVQDSVLSFFLMSLTPISVFCVAQLANRQL